MWQQEFTWFFAIFHHEFRKNNPVAFEVLMIFASVVLFFFRKTTTRSYYLMNFSGPRSRRRPP
jgi:hypothetical protein